MIVCPMCGDTVQADERLEALLRQHRLIGRPEAVLRALWVSRGRATTTERIFDWLYADDPNGGPTIRTMYSDLYAAIETLNYRLGGKLQIVPIGTQSGRWRLRITP